MIPIGKIVALAYVLVTVQRGTTTTTGSARGLYRIVEFIGRWSMLDVFVDTFVVALVQLSPLMSVDPGPGVVYFMAVVVLTMLAAQSFDPRLIWDAAARKAMAMSPPTTTCPKPSPCRRGARASRRSGSCRSWPRWWRSASR